MRIELIPGIESPVPGALCVGTADGQPLSYVDRTPYIGTEATTHAAIAEPLADAMDYYATKVFGGEWNGDLSRVTGINRRTVTHDRILRYGLAPWVLALVGRAAAHRHPRSLGFILLSLVGLRTSADREEARERESMQRLATQILDDAVDMIRYVSTERGKAPRHPSSKVT
ncbi:hypothetical protein HNR00_003090 [Methylorubrum rhodinum]|uniref:Uncharacterized protein n=1 Tax=Methylorubrum rhodinum TaxID=29428 RepID=A0A840ZM26_9HYPH|nr:hypothetical protein [Methylorubrum rhodinum]MBB5758370.1 hypothetical protein [Methylorubrum rhodinum]